MSDVEAIELAVRTLAKTERGRHTLESLLAWLEEGGIGLDARNQEAAVVLLRFAWGAHAGTVLDLIREVSR